MRKIILFLILLASSYLVNAQATVETRITVPYTTASTPTDSALLYLPNDYGSTGSQTYPLLVFLHGAGESCSPLSRIYTSLGSGGPTYFIEHAGWPTGGFVNPVDGQTYKFIVVSPQSHCNAWSTSGDELDNIMKFLVTNYRVDTNRIYGTGLSAGAAGVIEYSAHLNVNEDAPSQNTNTRRWKFAAVVEMSAASNDPPQSWGNIIVTDSIPYWNLGDQINDVHGDVSFDLNTVINTAKSGYSRFTGNPPFNTGHGPWNPFYIPTYTENFSWKGTTANYSIYTWLLANRRSSAAITTPTANAGSNQSITQPTSSVTLTGSVTPGSGHTSASTAWTKVSGPTCTITTPNNSLSTTVTGMNTAGIYIFQLTETNNSGVQATSQVTITVVSNAPVANGGGNQTITLPINTVTLNGGGSTGNVTSYSWTRVTGPNVPTIVSPTAVSTMVTGMIQGLYVFQLSVNAGASTALDSITVNPVRPCAGTRKYLSPDPGDSSIFIDYGTTPSVVTFLPGDTLAFKSSVGYGQVEIHGLTGSPGCPIVVTNEGGQAHIKGFFKFYGPKYVHIDGAGSLPTQYGFLIQDDPNNIVGDFRNGVGLQISELGKVVEVNNVFINHTIFGMAIKQSPDCPDSLNYPNWIMDSIYVHDNLIRQVGLEGMYIGDTSPDNSPTNPDPRAVTCPIGVGGSDSIIYPRPIRSGHMRIYNNIIDSTQRGGIQLSGHSDSVALIYGNLVMHNGMDGDEQQGTGISIGLYTQAYIHDNTVKNNTTWGIASLGGAGTNIPLRIENNVLDSTGFGNHYSNVTDTLFPITPSTPVHGPLSGIPAGNDYTFANPIFVKTVTNQDNVFTEFWIKTNAFGIWLAEQHKLFPSDSSAIQVNDFSVPPMFQKTGNIICGNTEHNSLTPASVFVDQSITNVPYSTVCGNIPLVGAGNNQSITLPTTSVTLSGTASGTGGNTITSTLWSFGSGPATPTIVTSGNLTTIVNGLSAPGVYVFNLKATDNTGATATSAVQVTVSAALPNNSNYIKRLRRFKRNYQ